MKKSKPCRTCGRDKPLTDFKKLPPLMTERSGTGLTHGHDCTACRLQARADRRAKRQADESDTPPLEQNNNPKLAMPYCMPVDIEYNGVDFVLTQENEGTTHTVFMAPHVLRGLWEWGQGLAKQEAAPASA